MQRYQPVFCRAVSGERSFLSWILEQRLEPHNSFGSATLHGPHRAFGLVVDHCNSTPGLLIDNGAGIY
jgi:hypothetical protein